MALYTWSSDFTNKKGTLVSSTALISDAEKANFQAVIDAYCPAHNTPYGATDNSTTGGCKYGTNGSYSQGSDCSYTVCGCGNDTADPAIGNTAKYCTSNA